ncbi:hypothetical protein JD971_00590 [Croceicoccus sp. YJ47]|nr:hypothetical protein JD971_00590 [Croceicoccus sp. YJ47]
MTADSFDGLPQGWGFDFVGEEGLRHALRMTGDGALVLDGGVRYRLLVLGGGMRMTLSTLERILSSDRLPKQARTWPMICALGARLPTICGWRTTPRRNGWVKGSSTASRPTVRDYPMRRNYLSSTAADGPLRVIFRSAPTGVVPNGGTQLRIGAGRQPIASKAAASSYRSKWPRADRPTWSFVKRANLQSRKGDDEGAGSCRSQPGLAAVISRRGTRDGAAAACFMDIVGRAEIAVLCGDGYL